MKRLALYGFVQALLVGPGVLGGELRIGVLDFHRAFKEYERRETLQREVDERKEAMNKELAKIEESLKARQSDLELLQPGTEKYRELQLALVQLETQLQVTKQMFQLELEKTRASHVQRLLGTLDKELQAYAKEEKLDLVLAKYAADPRLASPLYIVLYSKPEFDITAAIIERLNRGTEKSEKPEKPEKPEK
jgi:Skp family chaperone for outer membrane proteins